MIDEDVPYFDFLFPGGEDHEIATQKKRAARRAKSIEENLDNGYYGMYAAKVVLHTDKSKNEEYYKQLADKLVTVSREKDSATGILNVINRYRLNILENKLADELTTAAEVVYVGNLEVRDIDQERGTLKPDPRKPAQFIASHILADLAQVTSAE